METAFVSAGKLTSLACFRLRFDACLTPVGCFLQRRETLPPFAAWSSGTPVWAAVKGSSSTHSYTRPPGRAKLAVWSTFLKRVMSMWRPEMSMVGQPYIWRNTSGIRSAFG